MLNKYWMLGWSLTVKAKIVAPMVILSEKVVRLRDCNVSVNLVGFLYVSMNHSNNVYKQYEKKYPVKNWNP